MGSCCSTVYDGVIANATEWTLKVTLRTSRMEVQTKKEDNDIEVKAQLKKEPGVAADVTNKNQART